MVKSTFPNNKQQANTNSCGPTCLLNVYQKLKLSINLTDILKELNITEQDSTYPSQLASHANKIGLETLILSSNSYSLSREWENKKPKEVAELLKEWIKHNMSDNWIKDAIFLLFYLQEGGNLKILDLSIDIIDDYLSKNYILIVCLEESWLWGKRKLDHVAVFDSIKGHSRGHFVVLYDKTTKNYKVSDPYPTNIPNRDGLYEVSKQTLFNSVIMWNSHVIAIKKK